MSVSATVEVVCLFESLRNIDLLEQGLYNIRVRLSQDKENNGVPLTTFNISSPSRKVRNPRHQIFAPYITTNQNAYTTRSFWVQFVEELIELNEVVVFRIELNGIVDWEEASIILELDLMFSDTDSIASPQQMHSVAHQKYKIIVSKGLHQFYPLHFDEWHYCIIRFAVHSCLIDFSYKPAQKMFRLPSFSSKLQYNDNTDPDIVLFGVPWRKIMRAAFERLAKKFQLISTRLSTKQQITYAALLKSPVLQDRKDNRTSLEINNSSCIAGCEALDLPNISLPPRPVRGPLPQDSQIVEAAKEWRYIADQIFELWQRFLLIFALVGKEDTYRMSQDFDGKCGNYWKESFFREKVHLSSLDELLAIRVSPHRQMAETVRSSAYYKKLKPSPISLISVKPELSVQPIVFEQIVYYQEEGTTFGDGTSVDEEVDKRILKCASIKAANKEYEGVHLFVLLHGLLGNSWDMRMFRNQIARVLPESEFLICSSIEQMTLQDIGEMGEAVAAEILKYIKGLEVKVGRISFVGHSLGGVVLRAALTHKDFQPYLSKLHTFVSLSVPHIGTIFPSSQLIPSAMWVWQKWTNSTCLKQLRLLDHSDPYKTFLYKLSQEKGLSYFKNILLVSSEQDSYVPYHSARIEMRRDGYTDSSKHGAAFMSMVQNIWEPIIQKQADKLRVSKLESTSSFMFCGLAGKRASTGTTPSTSTSSSSTRPSTSSSSTSSSTSSTSTSTAKAGESSSSSSMPRSSSNLESFGTSDDNNGHNETKRYSTGDINNNNNATTLKHQCSSDYTVALRYDVIFSSHRGVDGVIGRAAHIRLLDNAKLMQMFLSNNYKYFT